MKIFALTLLATIALSSSTLIFAAECTSDDLTTITNTYSDAAMSEGASKCADLTTSTPSENYCKDSDCLDYMTKLLDVLPDCTTGGVNAREGLQAALDYCETGTADLSDVVTGSASTTAGSKTSDKESESTAAPAADGSSSASSISVAISSMKTSALSLLVAIGISSSNLVFAAECTTEDITAIGTAVTESVRNDVDEKCPELSTPTGGMGYCDSADCLKLIQSIVENIPDCTSGGGNIRAGWQTYLDLCETGGATATSTGSTTSTSSGSQKRTSSSSTASSSSSATAGSITSDNESTTAPESGGSGSSSASSVNVAFSSAILAVAAVLFTGAL
ncbi:hypothetical protein P3T76_002433 [Phytophthora citrophthora]|uniref:Elicitin n=1 Tax=Phytophthora citrophthora TaxID=4793 RepID=A0AAD9LSE3_9STRA|nr:hypothetical protein P3T76_002433 [Phytophthora citrophthora]